MKSKFTGILLPVILVLAACEVVYSPYPLGENAVTLNIEDWQGT